VTSWARRAGFVLFAGVLSFGLAPVCDCAADWFPSAAGAFEPVMVPFPGASDAQSAEPSAASPAPADLEGAGAVPGGIA
jgi:hypothetical protein